LTNELSQQEIKLSKQNRFTPKASIKESSCDYRFANERHPVLSEFLNHLAETSIPTILQQILNSTVLEERNKESTTGNYVQCTKPMFSSMFESMRRLRDV
jgi:hypothetical protein